MGLGSKGRAVLVSGQRLTQHVILGRTGQRLRRHQTFQEVVVENIRAAAGKDRLHFFCYRFINNCGGRPWSFFDCFIVHCLSARQKTTDAHSTGRPAISAGPGVLSELFSPGP